MFSRMTTKLAVFLCLLRGGSVALSLRQHSSRREWLAASSAFLVAADSALADQGSNLPSPLPTTQASAGRSFFPALTPPFRNRATYRYELGRNAWALEQLLTFNNVTATIRSNVLKLEDGSLWVHSPQYPTGELCALLDELGTVQHIVLPCNAFEHKAPLASFSRRYPAATVWIAPGQYGPLGQCGRVYDAQRTPRGMGCRVDGILGDGTPPWRDEIASKVVFLDIPGNAGPVSEVAFFHKASSTLVATDAVVSIPEEASPIFGTYFDQETIADPTFWARTVLQSVFLPLRTDDSGRYPGFEALKGRLVRAPILRALDDARAPQKRGSGSRTLSHRGSLIES